jgi:hypothetical protein
VDFAADTVGEIGLLYEAAGREQGAKTVMEM